MRSISFMLTQDQIRQRSKTVTRRLGWKNLKAGTLLRGVEKAMGLQKGESMRDLAVIAVISARIEPLSSITNDDVIREGFPEMNSPEFVSMFCEHMGCGPDEPVTRIEFKYVPGSAVTPRTTADFS